VDGTVSAEVKVKAEGAEQELLRLRSQYPKLVIQLVGMKKKLPSVEAVEMIVAQTIRARDTGALLASKPEVDILLRLAGTNQISEALQRIGYRSGDKRMLVVVGDEKELSRLRKDLADNASYKVRDAGSGIDDEGKQMVEVAALLGLRT
jgi:tRNA threonylcarbamoyladenosine modification (KEOPS) complex Cgi121 subunit